MRNKNALTLLCGAVALLWLTVLASYAAQNKLGIDKSPLMPTQDAGCSSSSSSSSE